MSINLTVMVFFNLSFQVTQFVSGLIESRADLSTFKNHIRDFLVQSKAFSAQVHIHSRGCITAIPVLKTEAFLSCIFGKTYLNFKMAYDFGLSFKKNFMDYFSGLYLT